MTESDNCICPLTANYISSPQLQHSGAKANQQPMAWYHVTRQGYLISLQTNTIAPHDEPFNHDF